MNSGIVLNIKKNGLFATAKKIKRKLDEENAYKIWQEKNRLDDNLLELQRRYLFKEDYKFSIVVPVYRTNADDKQREQEKGERKQPSAGNKQQCAYAVKHQSADYAGPIAPASYNGSGGQSHQKIAAIHHSLHIARLGFANVQRVLKMLVQHIEYAVCKSPQKEQQGDEGKGPKVIASALGCK